MEKIKVLIVDDHALVRDGINAMLLNQSDLQIVGEAANGEEAVSKAGSVNPDIILMDIMMPDMSGLEAARVIKDQSPGIKIIFLSMEVNEQFISEAINVGASGYLPKDSKRMVLIEAIHKVHEGGKYFSNTISEIVFEKFYQKSVQGKKTTPTVNSKISKREIEVITLIAAGLGNREIADKLFISVRTVDAHRNHILQKLNIHSTAELVKYAIKNNLVTLE
jgi:DNA-binding NarL/FixJ family response regulator